MQLLESIAPLAERYNYFILDLWGVIHDGQHLYPKVKECLQELRTRNKKIVFLSNAPRRVEAVSTVLHRMGITDDLYDKIITSGEVFYQSLAHPDTSVFKPQGKHYVYIGLERDRKVLEGLHYEEVQHPQHAQFVLLSHFHFDHQPMSEIMPILEECIQHKLPILCINPDTEIVRLSGEVVKCAGEIAEEYHMMGGEVIYFGKPHHIVYDKCFAEFGHVSKKEVIAIGDNLATDIKGAKNNHIANTLVVGGIMKEADSSHEELHGMLSREHITPDYVVRAFNW
jgi:HAD superfamily hydrolase (TIGR01459 family)